jgi:hypothetical protein
LAAQRVRACALVHESEALRTFRLLLRHLCTLTHAGNPETSAYFSSGGFSNYWARPPWQAAAVAKYIATAPNLPSTKVRRAVDLKLLLALC